MQRLSKHNVIAKLSFSPAPPQQPRSAVVCGVVGLVTYKDTQTHVIFS